MFLVNKLCLSVIIEHGNFTHLCTAHIYIIYTLCPRKVVHQVTLLVLNGFSKFFHC